MPLAIALARACCEHAVMNAFKYHFPRIQISTCFFHFGQNIFRKIVEIGLKKQYSEDENLRSFVKKLFVLHFYQWIKLTKLL